MINNFTDNQEWDLSEILRKVRREALRDGNGIMAYHDALERNLKRLENEQCPG